VAPFALRYRRAGAARWLRYLSPNGVVGETPFGETPFALSLSKGPYRGDTRAEGFARLSPNGLCAWLCSNGVVSETPFALSLSKGPYRGDTRDEGFDRLSPNGLCAWLRSP